MNVPADQIRERIRTNPVATYATSSTFRPHSSPSIVACQRSYSTSSQP